MRHAAAEEDDDDDEEEEEAPDSRRRADRTMSMTDGLAMEKSVEWSRALRRPENFFIALQERKNDSQASEEKQSTG